MLYIIMNATCDEVFSGYNSLGRAKWTKVSDIVQEPTGFELCVYKTPSIEMKCLEERGYSTVSFRITDLEKLLNAGK